MTYNIEAAWKAKKIDSSLFKIFISFFLIKT